MICQLHLGHFQLVPTKWHLGPCSRLDRLIRQLWLIVIMNLDTEICCQSQHYSIILALVDQHNNFSANFIYLIFFCVLLEESTDWLEVGDRGHHWQCGHSAGVPHGSGWISAGARWESIVPVCLTSTISHVLTKAWWMCCVSDSIILNCQMSSGIQGGRVAHDQATMVELKSMLSEMKELLHQQVTCVPGLCVLQGELLKDCSKWSGKEEQNFQNSYDK